MSVFVEQKIMLEMLQRAISQLREDEYLDGVGIRAIKFKLEQARIPTATGNANWHEGTISRILQNSFYCGIIKYHKWFTPDYLEQKKIRNFGDIDYTIIRGSHEPIVTEEEYERVQRLVASRRQNMPNQNYAGRRKPIGKKQSCDVWTDIMICECGHKFNRKVWHRLEDSVQYGYQCYGSICTGTVATRLKKEKSSRRSLSGSKCVRMDSTGI